MSGRRNTKQTLTIGSMVEKTRKPACSSTCMHLERTFAPGWDNYEYRCKKYDRYLSFDQLTEVRVPDCPPSEAKYEDFIDKTTFKVYSCDACLSNESHGDY